MNKFRTYFLLLVAFFLVTIGDVLAAGSVGYVVSWGAYSEKWKSHGGEYIASNAVQIAAGGSHGLALNSDGIVTGWGGNFYGEINIPVGLSNVIAIAAGDGFSAALRNDGHVVSWGKEMAVSNNLANVTAIAAGNYALFAMTRDGKVFRMAFNDLFATSVSNATEIAASGGHNSDSLVVLKADNTFSHMGSEFQLPPQNVTNVSKLALGKNHGLALRKDGKVLGWGNNYAGQATGTPTKGPDRVANGFVTDRGQILSNIVDLAAAGDYSLFLKDDGTVMAFGDKLWRTTAIPEGLRNVIAIAAGPHFALAITTNRAVADEINRRRFSQADGKE